MKAETRAEQEPEAEEPKVEEPKAEEPIPSIKPEEDEPEEKPLFVEKYDPYEEGGCSRHIIVLTDY